MINLKNIRFEVIDDSGRAYSKYGVDVELSVQDSGRTLKLFVTENQVQSEQMIQEMAQGFAEFVQKERLVNCDFCNHHPTYKCCPKEDGTCDMFVSITEENK